MLLDGHLRLHALRERGAASAPCIVSDDDEAFTYNKRVNRLATVQEHYVITRAIDRGVPAAMIAAALGLDEKAVQRRRNLVDGMASMGNFTAAYAKAILAATRQEDLARPDRPKAIAGVTADQMARMERELEKLAKDFRATEGTFGDDVLQLVLASRYAERLIANEGVRKYLEERHADLLEQSETIVAATSLEAQ